jgi:hypothetical protein
MAQSPKIMNAKTVYFEDGTGVDKVGEAALVELKKWGRFQTVADKKNADLIFIFSADPYKGDYITLASGNTGPMEEDRVPDYNLQAPVRDAYLSVVDTSTGNLLWSESGDGEDCLPGETARGERLVKKLESEMQEFMSSWCGGFRSAGGTGA